MAKKTARKKPVAKKAAVRRTRQESPGPEPTPAQTPFSVPPDRIESALVTGENPGLMEDYFGPEAYRQMRDLALNASTRSVRGGPRVLILPGIMGSTLARKGTLGLDNTLWIDPIEIARGHLDQLALGSGSSPY